MHNGCLQAVYKPTLLQKSPPPSQTTSVSSPHETTRRVLCSEAGQTAQHRCIASLRWLTARGSCAENFCTRNPSPHLPASSLSPHPSPSCACSARGRRGERRWACRWSPSEIWRFSKFFLEIRIGSAASSRSPFVWSGSAASTFLGHHDCWNWRAQRCRGSGKAQCWMGSGRARQ
jgi:hypothetical protein